MKKHILIAISAFFLLSCKNLSRYYKQGEVDKSEFHEQIAFERTFGLIIVPVKIGDKEYRFLFDTGAPMVISNELKEEYNLKTKAEGNVRDSQNQRQKLGYVSLPDLILGNTTFSKLTAITADLKASPEIGCLEIDGILGANLMRHAHWKIDFSKNTLTLQSNNFQVPESSNEISFYTSTTFTPKIKLKADGIEISDVTFDSGSAGFLSLEKKALRKDSLQNTSRESYGFHSSGLFGSKMDTLYYQKSTIEFEDGNSLEALVKIPKNNTKSLLGVQFLENYDVYLNWDDQKAHLDRRKQINQKDESYGFSPKVLEGDIIIVGSVLNKSEAERLGVSIGDTIESVYPIHQKESPLYEYCELREKLYRWKSPLILKRLNKEPVILTRETIVTESTLEK